MTRHFRRGLALSASLALTVAGLMVPVAAHAATETIVIDHVTYSYDPQNIASGATLTSATFRVKSDLVVPATIEAGGQTYDVTAVATDALQGKSLKSLRLPDSVTTIGARAFARNTSLASVNIPSGITEIPDEAFARTKLGALTIPDTVTRIGASAFEQAGLTSLSLPDTLTEIGSAAFKSNAKLTSVKLPNHLQSIPASAFLKSGLETVTIPETVTSIGPAAFADSQLTSVTLPDSVTTIGPSAFESNNITSVKLPANLQTLPASVFQTNKITAIDFPATITEIGDEAFANNALTEVSLPPALTVVQTDSFAANKLTSVTLPEGITTINKDAFRDNTITTLRIPASVTTIGRQAFGMGSAATVFFDGAAPTIHEPGTGFQKHFGSFGDPAEVTVKVYESFADTFGNPWKKYTVEVLPDPTGTLTVASKSTVTGARDNDSLPELATGAYHHGATNNLTPVEGIISDRSLKPGTYALAISTPTVTGKTFTDEGWVCTHADGSQVPVTALEPQKDAETGLTINARIDLAAHTQVTCTHTFTYALATPNNADNGNSGPTSPHTGSGNSPSRVSSGPAQNPPSPTPSQQSAHKLPAKKSLAVTGTSTLWLVAAAGLLMVGGVVARRGHHA